jgi:hypothetical protein
MRIEAVTVCVGYGDFLAATARENRHLLDDWVIVTSPDDDETRDVCRRHSIRHVLSEEHRRGGPFNKGRLIQRAYSQLGADDWILHLDADVVLPRQFRSLLDVAHLEEDCIHGVDRCNVVGWDAWRRIGSWDNHSYENYLTFAGLPSPAGARWASTLHGYVPIGFFQLFHGTAMIDRGKHLRHYPYNHSDASHSDVQFGLQWDRRHRRLLPEVIVLHLESEPARLGANWAGRTTARFGPEPAGRPAPSAS